jgi:hypothetical protein
MAHQVVLNWIAPATGDAPASYNVLRAPVVSGVVGTYASIASVNAPTVTYTDTNVVAGDSYSYEVESVDGSGASAPCTAITVTIPVAAPNPPTGLTGTAS